MDTVLARSLSCGIALFCALICRANEPEPWADRTLRPAGDLLLWLDAARLPAAWQNHGKYLAPGANVDVWFDASGNGKHLNQRVRDAQPSFVVAGDRAVIRFDGKDDFLAIDQISVSPHAAGKEPAGNVAARALERFTVFVVAAPRSNPGGFRAFLAAHELGKNDYVTGFNIDMSASASDRFGQINFEGRGFGGAVNLMRSPLSFGGFHIIELTCEPGPDGVQLYIDGQRSGSREREPGLVRMDALFLGARCYSNSAEPPFMTGFLEGDVAELLMFRGVLASAERAKVRQYLSRKHAGLTEAIAALRQPHGRLLQPIADSPPVQILAPGFSVRELPLELTNLNNVRYRSDGKLIALGYDGNIWVISDSDGDGVEDKAEAFWENRGRLRGPIGIALTPPGYPHGDGLFVASKGKLTLIVDTDKDDRADKEIVVATGWKEIPQNVDAIGVALARDGSVYFGLGTANYANGYLLDPEGTSHYDITGERGTVLRVAPDFSKRDIVCTGVRFPVAMAFNRHGDLFCSDQEGATWLPNGNPFDELLHIVPGRHYGFPPRHPRHLTQVIDEPSVYDYGPQHQSTCGLLFNEPIATATASNAVFGPAWWRGDALVCGESRGKIYRTKLAKTSTGYLAINSIIACLSMLTVDACLSPSGELVVCCHSGPPDWGTGPQGKGKLFKIRFERRDAPQPVLAWAAGTGEVRIAFDQPLDLQQLRNLAGVTAIEYGPHVRPGDRYETLKPPYAVVQMQTGTHRFDLPVLSASVTPDRRTMVLSTTPQTHAVPHAIRMTSEFEPPRGAETLPAAGRIPQKPGIEIGYDLTGVEAAWRSDQSQTAWAGWLPHLDLVASRTFTLGSAEHEALWPLLGQSGKLTLRAQLDLWNMLRPAVQPGSAIDYTPPPEEVTVIMRSSAPIEVRSPDSQAALDRDGDRYVARFTTTLREPALLPVEVDMQTGGASPTSSGNTAESQSAATTRARSDRSTSAAGNRLPTIEISFVTNEDSRERPVAQRRVLVPWARLQSGALELAAKRTIPELADGNWLRGRQVFHSDQAACSKCHRLRGRGGRIGPDLDNLPHRDYGSVRRDLLQPSAAINPDHLSYVIATKDGRVLTGVPLASNNQSLVIGDTAGKEITLAQSDIAELKPSAVSIMPDNLGTVLAAENLRDLITFLMTEPIDPAPLTRRDAPPPRTRRSIAASLQALGTAGVGAKASSGVQRELRRMHIALVAGPKDHGPDEHDYPVWQSRWATLLQLAENVEVSQSSAWPTREQFENADVIVFYSANPAWSAEKAPELDAFLRRGGGLVYVHFAVNGGNALGELADRIGLAAHGRSTKYRHGPLDLAFNESDHPITRGFNKANGLDRVQFLDESYWNMTGDATKINVLATAVEEGESRPLLWTRELTHASAEGAEPARKGRIFVSILGHYTWTFDDPLFRILLLRGICWSAGEPADRLSELATIGARLVD